MKGKMGRKVPILFTEKMLVCIDYIINHRQQHGVPKSNLYVFACPHTQNPIRGYDAVKFTVSKSGGSGDL